MLQDPTQADEPSVLQSQDDHATDEEKLASSTNHKWAARHDMDNDLDSDRPSAFVNEDSLSHQNIGRWGSNVLCSQLLSDYTVYG